jgi:urease accessory protein
VAHDRHDGPLRVLQPLYPEGPAICHHVLVHPPGGIVGGDDLQIDVDVQARAHALITTPGATRFYRSAGPLARQRAHLRVGAGARLEWLPLETLVHDGCRAHNTLRLELAEGASMIGWDILALGLPASAQPLRTGCFEQRIDWPARWLEETRLDFDDEHEAALTRRLLASPLGWAGHSVLATAWCAAHPAWSSGLTEALTEAARVALSSSMTAPPAHVAALAPAAPATACAGAPAPLATWGVTCPQPGLIVARGLAARTEAAWPALQALRAAWRQVLWGLPDVRPRVWRT